MKAWHFGAAAVGVACGFLGAHAARAERGLPVGACVIADKRNPGRIAAVLPYAYSVKGPGNATPMIWPFDDVVAGPCVDAPPPVAVERAPISAPAAAAGGGMCFANDAVGAAGLQGQVRSVLVRGFAHEPQPGEDGRITVHINALRIGAARPASPMDAMQYQTVAGRTVYDVRVSFDTCTDYNRRIVLLRRERNFVCFHKASGPFDCSMTANSPGLAPDEKREVVK